MFGLRIGPKIIWRAITGNTEVQKIEQEVIHGFQAGADYLIHRHGAALAHLAMDLAVKEVKALFNLSIPGSQKKAQVAGILRDAISQAGAEFDTGDIDGVIQAAYGAVRADIAAAQLKQ